MTEQEIQRKIDDRKNAIDILGKLFDKSLRFSYYICDRADYAEYQIMNASKDYVERQLYFRRKFSPEAVSSAENYVRNGNEKYKNFKLTNRKSVILYDTYLGLLQELGEYDFVADDDNTYGDKQNKTNRNILLYFTLFEDEIMQALKLLDTNINNNPELKEKMVMLEENLQQAINLLYTKRTHYHNTWNNMNRPSLSLKYFDVSSASMSRSKKNWRLERNRACRTALQFIKWLEDLVIKYNPEFKSNFKDYIKYLRNQPYYFCFIDDQQKKQLEEAKRLRKEQSRQMY